MTAPPPPARRAWATVSALVAACAREYGEREALVSIDERFTHRELEQRSAALARALVAAGVPKYARIGFVMPNSPQWAATWLAITRIGAVAVPISTFASSST